MSFDCTKNLHMPFIVDPDIHSWCYCGFRVNIQNPYCHELYRRFEKSRNLPTMFPISEKERFEFEQIVIPHLEKRFGVKAPRPMIPPKIREKLPIELLKQIYGVTGMGCVDELLEKVKESDRQFAPQTEAADDAEDFEEIEISTKK